MSLLPKEHGAYGQLAYPLITSYAIAGVNRANALLGLALVAAFLSHEPLLVVLGRRGARATRAQGHRALAWFSVTAVIALGAGVLAWQQTPATFRWTLMIPLAPAAIALGAMALDREKTGAGEVAIALTFSSSAIPVCLAAGAAPAAALSVATTFAVVFVPATLAVRATIIASRGGGNPGAARMLRAIVLVLVVLASAVLAMFNWRGLLPAAASVAAMPGLGVALWLALFPPPATRLRVVGWALIATSTTAAVILIAGLRGG
jgi:hypothetical protein